jgi:glycosyltransferase involved in cell wall biosynthesis
VNKIIRVLHTEWSDGWGGQEIRIINEMIVVREKNIEVFLACRNHAIIKQKALENNIKVFTLPFRGNADLQTLFGLKKIIEENSIDIVNTHSGKDTWVGGLAAKLSGVIFIRTRHLSNSIRSSRANFINELADYIITTGEIVRNDMINNNRIKPEIIQSIPTGVDSEIFNPEKYERKKCREQFNIEDNEIAIGIVAVLRRFKRHDLFLKMARILIDKYSGKNFTFLIAGDGPQKKRILDLINELDIVANVKLLGHVDQVPELLSALDVFVLSSDSKEGVPQSVVQALSMNISVVATNSGSTRDLLNKNSFYLADTNNVDDLVKGVSYFLHNSFRNKTREYILTGYTKSVMSNKIIQMYKGLIKN